MSDNQWEDDDFFDGDEETDMGDEDIQASGPAPNIRTPDPTPGISNRTGLEGRRPHDVYSLGAGPVKNRHEKGSKGKRTVRVRPMPPSMSAKWPDVVSCLLTLGSGKQVMFVKGG